MGEKSGLRRLRRLQRGLAECDDARFVRVRSDGETPRFVLVSDANEGSEVLASGVRRTFVDNASVQYTPPCERCHDTIYSR